MFWFGLINLSNGTSTPQGLFNIVYTMNKKNKTKHKKVPNMMKKYQDCIVKILKIYVMF